MIPYAKQSISEEDIQSVVDVLHSDFITQGPVTPLFEQAITDYCGTAHAIATNSGTSALHLACLALNLQAGDHLWTTPITFVASANCARYCGAHVDFVDIDPHTNNISLTALEAKLSASRANGTLPKILIVVHLTGEPCDLEAIHALSAEYGFRVIEDAAHALGARYRHNPVGNCKYSDISIFSFHPAKAITTAEGGMAVTNRADLASRMRLLCSHGITRNPAQMTHKPDGSWYYQQIELGYNYRLSDLHAALGLSQLKKLDHFIELRHRIADRYNEALRGLPITLPQTCNNSYSALHLYVVRLQTQSLTYSTDTVFERLRSEGIGVNKHYIPLHLQPYYQELGHQKGDFPEAERYYHEAISLPIFPDLSLADQDQVIQAIRRAIA